ncbi:hypothetical protein Dimus_029166 [Dionaea muscipula]
MPHHFASYPYSLPTIYIHNKFDSNLLTVFSSFCSQYPLAAQVRASEARRPSITRNHAGIGAAIAIMVGVVLTILLAMGFYYVMITRQEKLNPGVSDPVRPDV